MIQFVYILSLCTTPWGIVVLSAVGLAGAVAALYKKFSSDSSSDVGTDDVGTDEAPAAQPAAASSPSESTNVASTNEAPVAQPAATTMGTDGVVCVLTEGQMMLLTPVRPKRSSDIMNILRRPSSPVAHVTELFNRAAADVSCRVALAEAFNAAAATPVEVNVSSKSVKGKVSTTPSV